MKGPGAVPIVVCVWDGLTYPGIDCSMRSPKFRRAHPRPHRTGSHERRCATARYGVETRQSRAQKILAGHHTLTSFRLLPSSRSGCRRGRQILGRRRARGGDARTRDARGSQRAGVSSSVMVRNCCSALAARNAHRSALMPESAACVSLSAGTAQSREMNRSTLRLNISIGEEL